MGFSIMLGSDYPTCQRYQRRLAVAQKTEGLRLRAVVSPSTYRVVVAELVRHGGILPVGCMPLIRRAADRNGHSGLYLFDIPIDISSDADDISFTDYSAFT